MAYIILGAGDAAIENAQILKDCGVVEEIEFIVSEDYYDIAVSSLPHRTMIHVFRYFRAKPSAKFVVGVGAPEVKYSLVKQLREVVSSPNYATFIHPTLFATNPIFAEGVTVMGNCSFALNVAIGRYSHISHACSIGHDTEIDSYCEISPGVDIAGRVKICEGAFIGIGATILPNITIGAWSRVGAGCVVIQDVPPNSTAIGVPGRVARTREKGWHEPK